MNGSQDEATSHRRKIRPRCTLNEQQAIDIYKLKPSTIEQLDLNKHKRASPSATVAKKYGVSPKTVRDIWCHRSWGFATTGNKKRRGVNILPAQAIICLLLMLAFCRLNRLCRQVSDPPREQRRGRPKGSRDKHPRFRKIPCQPSNPVAEAVEALFSCKKQEAHDKSVPAEAQGGSADPFHSDFPFWAPN
jgi:hypothetical protein